jgi:hypothetical protein
VALALNELGFDFKRKFSFKNPSGVATYFIFQRPDTTP